MITLTLKTKYHLKKMLQGCLQLKTWLLKDLDEESEHTIVRFGSSEYEFFYGNSTRNPKVTVDYYIP